MTLFKILKVREWLWPINTAHFKTWNSCPSLLTRLYFLRFLSHFSVSGTTVLFFQRSYKLVYFYDLSNKGNSVQCLHMNLQFQPIATAAFSISLSEGSFKIKILLYSPQYQDQTQFSKENSNPFLSFVISRARISCLLPVLFQIQLF